MDIVISIIVLLSLFAAATYHSLSDHTCQDLALRKKYKHILDKYT
jgi:hypothetical protein